MSDCMKYGWIDENDASIRISFAQQQIQKYQNIINKLNDLLQKYDADYVVLYEPNGTALNYPDWLKSNIQYEQINEPEISADVVHGSIAIYHSIKDAEVAKNAWLSYQPKATIVVFGNYLKGIIDNYQKSIQINQEEIENVKRCLQYFKQKETKLVYGSNKVYHAPLIRDIQTPIEKPEASYNKIPEKLKEAKPKPAETDFLTQIIEAIKQWLLKIFS